jgi:hypothetical protein
LLLSDGPSSYDFGTLATNSSTSHLFVLTNGGAATATSVASSLTGVFAFVGGGYPGVGGTCGPSVPAGASCALNVGFTPTAAGPASATLTVTYFDGAHATQVSRDLGGHGTTHAFLAITDFPVMYYTAYGLHADPATFAFGAHGLGSTTVHTFVVTNNGSVTATSMTGDALGAPFSYAGGSYPGTSGTCGATLAPGDDCTVVVAFKPTSVAGGVATLTVEYNDGGGANSASRPMSGTGTSAPLLVIQDFDVTNLYPGGWDFGTRGIGNADSHQFYVSNTGGAAAVSMQAPAIGSGFGYVGGTYPGSGGTCSTTLSAGGTCTVNVFFQPAATGPATGAVKINYRDGVGTQLAASRVVTGTGTMLGLVQIDQKSNGGDGLYTSFGSVAIGSAAEQGFTVRNIGGGSVSGMSFSALGAPFSFAGGTFPGNGGDCGTTLVAGASCTIVVDFTPTTVASFSATLSMTYSDGVSSEGTSRGLVGQGVDGAELQISAWSNGGSDPSFDYGAWGVPVDHTFYVTNHGNKTASAIAAIAPSAPFSWKGGTFPGAGGSCSTANTLAVGGSCLLVVTFSGAASGSTTFGVSYADGTGNTKSATLDVTGEVAPNAMLVVTDCNGCGVDSNPADFGTTSTSAGRSFVVTNNGGKTATMLHDGGLLAAPFGYTGGNYPGSTGSPGPGGPCSATLDPGASCSVYLTFTPPASGSYASTLGIAYDDGTGTSATATRAVIGARTSLALLHVHDWSEADTGGGDVYNFGTAGIPIDHVFTITNDGSQTATSMGDGNGLGSGFNWKGGHYPGTGGDCVGQLAASGICRVVVTFTPTGNGYTSSTMLIAYYDGANGQYAKRAISASGTTAALLQITDGDQPPTNPWEQNPPPYDYGTVGQSADATFTIKNWGAATATVITDGGTLGNGFAWTGAVVYGGGTCGAQLASGASCTVKVTFSPSGDGPRTSTLSVSYNDGGTTQVATRVLTGTATTKALVNVYDWWDSQGGSKPGNQSWTPPPYDYGLWGLPVEHTFTLRNDGGGAASMLANGGSMGTGFAWKDGSYPGTGGDCMTSLGVGATCSVVVVFTPGGPGTLSGQMRVSYNDGAVTRTAVRSLMGTGTTNANLTVSEYFGPNFCTDCTPYDMGSVAVGGSIEHTFTITNTGARTATAIAPTSTLVTPFSYKGVSGYPGTGGDCGAMLAAGNSCSLVVVFTPQSSGLVMGTLGITFSDSTMFAGMASRAIQGTGN